MKNLGYGETMFFHNAAELARVVVVGLAGYLFLVASVRLAGKRSLAKMNAFDLVVTVALGSAMATILLSAQVALAEGAAAVALLVGLQFTVTWLSVRSRSIRRLVKSQPTLLLCDGRMLHDRMRRQRVTDSEVRQALRAHGYGDLEQVAAVVLETDGSFSVVPRSQLGAATALHGVAGSPWQPR